MFRSEWQPSAGLYFFSSACSACLNVGPIRSLSEKNKKMKINRNDHVKRSRKYLTTKNVTPQ